MELGGFSSSSVITSAMVLWNAGREILKLSNAFTVRPGSPKPQPASVPQVTT